MRVQLVVVVCLVALACLSQGARGACADPPSSCVLTGVSTNTTLFNGVQIVLSVSSTCPQNLPPQFRYSVQQAVNSSYSSFFPQQYCATNVASLGLPLQCTGLPGAAFFQVVATGPACSRAVSTFQTPGDCQLTTVVIDCASGRVQFSCAAGTRVVLEVQRAALNYDGSYSYPVTRVYQNATSPFNVPAPDVTSCDKMLVTGVDANGVGKSLTAMCAPLFLPSPNPTPECVNVAQMPWGTASQSSTPAVTDRDLTAAEAIDGVTIGTYGNISETDFTPSPWWRVALYTARQISSVMIFPRTDCCQDRLRNFDVTIRNGASTVWTTYVAAAVTTPLTLIVPGSVIGDSVQIQLRDNNSLALAEVQVFSCTDYCSVPTPQSPPAAPIFIGTSMSCGSVGLTVAPVDSCPPDTLPLYEFRLTRVSNNATGPAVNTSQPTYSFLNLDLADYTATVTVRCMDACNRPVTSSSSDLLPGFTLRPLVCCCATCQCWGYTSGDPHVRTLDGAHVDYLLPGDYVMFEGTNFTVHSRMCMRQNSAASWNCALAVRCGTTTFSQYTYETNATLVHDINGTQVVLTPGTTYRVGPNGVLQITFTAPDPSTPWYRETAVTCNLPGAVSGMRWTMYLRSVGPSGFYQDISYWIPGALARLGRGLISGRFDNNTYNDIAWRNGSTVAFPMGYDPSTESMSSAINPIIDRVQLSWAVYPGLDSLLTRTIAREAPSQMWWTRPSRRHLLQSSNAVLDTLSGRKLPSDAQIAAGLTVCAPFMASDGISLSFAAFDWALLNGTRDCKNIALSYAKNSAPEIGMDVTNADEPIVLSRRRMHTSGGSSSSKNSRAGKRTRRTVSACAVGNQRIVVRGRFPEGVASAAVGGVAAKVVTAAKNRVVIRTQNFMSAVGSVDLELTTPTGKKAAWRRGIVLKSSEIKSVTPNKAAPLSTVRINGDFGNMGVKSVDIGGLPCRIMAASRTQVLVQLPLMANGPKNVVVRTKRCYGDAVLTNGFTVTDSYDV